MRLELTKLWQETSFSYYSSRYFLLLWRQICAKIIKQKKDQFKTYNIFSAKKKGKKTSLPRRFEPGVGYSSVRDVWVPLHQIEWQQSNKHNSEHFKINTFLMSVWVVPLVKNSLRQGTLPGRQMAAICSANHSAILQTALGTRPIVSFVIRAEYFLSVVPPWTNPNGQTRLS